jgi:hypothetical protein
VWAGGIDTICRDWGGLKGSACSRSLPTIEPRRCRRFSLTARRLLSVQGALRGNERAIRIKQSGRERREGKSWPTNRSLPHLHCSQRRRTAMLSPHRTTLLRRAGRAMFVLFLLFCIFPFSCSKIINIPSLNSGLISCVFFFFLMRSSRFTSLIMKENRYSALEAWIRAKKITECCIGLALSAFLSIFSVFVARHVQGKHGGLWVVSWFLS